MVSKTTASLLVLIIAVIATSFLSYSMVHKNIPVNKTSKQTIDFFMRNVHYVSMDKNGKPLHYLDSPYIEHYQKNDSYVLKSPKLKTLDSKGDVWFITAKNGKTMHGTKIITLVGDVNIKRPAPQHPSKKLTIVTNDATFYPEKKYAITKDLTTLIQPGTIVKSIGAKVDFDKQSVKLFSQIKSIFKITN